MTLDNASSTGHVTARQFSAIEQRFEHAPRPWRQIFEFDLFFCPKQNTCTQAIWLHQALHEAHLVDASLQKEFRERGKRFLAQIPATIQIVTPTRITSGEVLLVILDIPCQTTRYGPNSTSVQRL